MKEALEALAARAFNVSSVAISKVLLGKSWRHVTGFSRHPDILAEIDRLRDSTPYAPDLGKPGHCNGVIICGEGKRG